MLSGMLSGDRKDYKKTIQSFHNFNFLWISETSSLYFRLSVKSHAYT